MRRLSPLHRKLFRELWQRRGQVLAIALVMGAGIGMYILSISNLESLRLSQEVYYERYRFADVFANLKRAPQRLAGEIGEIPGVRTARTRVVTQVTLDMPGLADPATGRLVSIPEVRRPVLNDVFLRRGRYVEPGRPDEVLVSEAFALAHGLVPGDSVRAVIHGRRRDLTIVGLALSPEFIYQIRPGELVPDDSRYGIFWMGRPGLAAAVEMEGGFNDVVLQLTPGARLEDVIARLDRLLAPYGGLGAYGRSLHPSHWYLDNEFQQLRGMAAVVPVIFLAVAAFLLNVVLSRTVDVQRQEIAVIKALGYSNRAVATHFALWSVLISLLGAALGIALGAWLGHGLAELYADFFRFPILHFVLPASLWVQGLVLSLAAGLGGALTAVRRAVRMVPAEAMRPPLPARYRETWIERAGLKGFFSQPARMIFRNLERHLGRAALSVAGIAASVGLLVVGTFTSDSMGAIIDQQFYVAQRFDVLVTTVEPVSRRALHELERLPGVVHGEPFRSVPVRLRAGPRSRRTSILAQPPDAELNRLVGRNRAVVTLPPDGLVLSAKLADILAVAPGDEVGVEVLEGRRPVARMVVARLVDDYMGTNAYMAPAPLHRLLGEGESLSGAYLAVDEALEERLYERLKATPGVAGVTRKRSILDSFDATIAEMVGTMRGVTVLFAAIIAFGVVYNAARISLAERGRELATLRVIGFTRAEIAYVLLGDLAVVTLLALPVGLVFGYALAALTIASAGDNEAFRMPLMVLPRTYAFACLTTLVAAILSGLLVRRRIDRLDLVAVLKTRE